MKVPDIKKVYLLSAEIMCAEAQIKKSFPRPGKGYENVPSAGFHYDQKETDQIDGVAQARDKLAHAIHNAFRQYRKDLVKIFKEIDTKEVEEEPCQTMDNP